MVHYHDPIGQYAKHTIDKYHDDIVRSLPPAPRPPPDVPSTFSPTKDDWGLLGGGHVLVPCPRPNRSAPVVGIVGAGVGGLYAGMMLQSVGVSYEILEASSRIGGRLYTYRFSNAKHDYYDVGAMRFPDTPMMKRTFDLFDLLRLRPINYIAENSQALLLFNDILRQQGSATEDPRSWDVQNIPSRYAQRGYTALIKNAIYPFAEGIVQDFESKYKSGWDQMMQYDQYSTRAYMSGNRSDTRADLDKLGLMPYPTAVVNWLETFDSESSTGAYDRALSERVLQYVGFEFPGIENVQWWCIDGGSQVIADEMVKQLKYDPVTCARVNTISYDPYQTETPMQVLLAGGSEKSYSHVITTTSLPVLRTFDLTTAACDSAQKTAMRELRCGPATRIGVKFKTAWWTDKKVVKTGSIVGGESLTDRMARVVVYPSYGTSGSSQTTVLIVSYCRTDDATRYGALFDKQSEGRLKDIVIRDLVALHGLDRVDGYKFLQNQWVAHHTHSWDNDPYTIGGFGFFGPGNFSEVYCNLTRPAAKGRLHFAGEALSARHGWVVGALDASWRAVHQILISSFPEKVQEFEEKWGSNSDWTTAALAKQVAYSMILQGSGKSAGRA